MADARLILRTRDRIPASAYRDGLQVRSYEVGRDGCVHPATILRYLEHLATCASAAVGFDHAWYEQQGQAWVVREMLLLLGTPSHMDDRVALATWLSDFRRVQAYRECAAWNADTGRRIARARGRWGYIDRATGLPTRVPRNIIDVSPIEPSTLLPRPLPEFGAPEFRASQAGEQTLKLTARRYEADSQLHVNNCVYVDWLEEALDTALGEGAPEEAPCPRWPRYYHLEYVRPTYPGDRVRVITRWSWPSPRRLLVEQEIASEADGALAVRARSEHLRRLLTSSAARR
jgi:acyl-CoA thioesterase FadM